jgi:hypothetical protein
MKEITNRIGVHKVGLAILQELNWLEREQPISDYGIDMQIEIINDNRATGQLIAVQIKSGKSYFSETTDNSIVYRGEKKHLDYWQFHSIPVLIVLYNPENDKIYWEKILSKNTIETDKGWKINIPKTNILDKECKEAIEKYYYNRNHFFTIELSDSSHGLARRITAKILVDKSAISKSSMKRMIPFLVQDFKNSDYHRNERIKDKFNNQPVDIVFLFFYNNIQQAKRGLPFCRAFWNSEQCKTKVELNNPDWEEGGIQIKWDKNYEVLNEMMNENQMSKAEFLEIAKDTFKSSLEVCNAIKRVYEESKSKSSHLFLQTELLKFETRINEIKNAITFKDQFVPLECEDLSNLVINSAIHLDNILIVIKDESRNEQNKLNMVNQSLKECDENLKYFNYELKKIK